MSSVILRNPKTSVRSLQERYGEAPKTRSSHSKSPKVVFGFAARSCVYVYTYIYIYICTYVVCLLLFRHTKEVSDSE